MKIYGSTEYFDRDKQTDTYLELFVVSQWDFSQRGLCFKTIDNSTISFGIRQGNPFKVLKKEDITEEVKTELINRGYRF